MFEYLEEARKEKNIIEFDLSKSKSKKKGFLSNFYLEFNSKQYDHIEFLKNFERLVVFDGKEKIFELNSMQLNYYNNKNHKQIQYLSKKTTKYAIPLPIEYFTPISNYKKSKYRVNVYIKNATFIIESHLFYSIHPKPLVEKVVNLSDFSLLNKSRVIDLLNYINNEEKEDIKIIEVVIFYKNQEIFLIMGKNSIELNGEEILSCPNAQYAINFSYTLLGKKRVRNVGSYGFCNVEDKKTHSNCPSVNLKKDKLALKMDINFGKVGKETDGFCWVSYF